jgi:hypothetical protein
MILPERFRDRLSATDDGTDCTDQIHRFAYFWICIPAATDAPGP